MKEAKTFALLKNTSSQIPPEVLISGRIVNTGDMSGEMDHTLSGNEGCRILSQVSLREPKTPRNPGRKFFPC